MKKKKSESLNILLIVLIFLIIIASITIIFSQINTDPIEQKNPTIVKNETEYSSINEAIKLKHFLPCVHKNSNYTTKLKCFNALYKELNTNFDCKGEITCEILMVNKTKNYSHCMNKDYCILQSAIHFKNKELCEQIENEQTQLTCIFSFIKEPEDCFLYKDNQRIWECYIFGFKIKNCNDFKTDKVIQKCKELETNLIENELEKCKENVSCKIKEITKFNNIIACENQKLDIFEKELCYTTIAKKTGNTKICENVDKLKEFCTNFIENKVKPTNICEEFIKFNRTQKEIEECKILIEKYE